MVQLELEYRPKFSFALPFLDVTPDFRFLEDPNLLFRYAFSLSLIVEEVCEKQS